MAKLLRIEGNGGTKIYSGEYYSEESAVNEYIDETGYEPTKTDSFGFDQCEWTELKNFTRRGNE
ncbi:hypothetical protein [uncultured Zhongshania sp.]|uniref:hypothetical protein n=1 Tax=uncultured Zhongshania sp. TaxID=1642288 RepID=UPI0030DC27B6|tara:strand:+ start:72 stop:263 length:192 start_codon:yes stop_codon:yes gene_type:complete